MKKFFKLSIIIGFSNLLLVKIWALESKFDKEMFLFPEQHSLIYDPTPSVLNPFKMSSFGIGGGFCEPFDNLKNTFRILIPSHWCNVLGAYVELRTETPYYRDKVSLGFETGIAKGEAYGLEMVNPSVLFTLKGRLPFYTSLGSFGLTVTPKLGPTYLYRNYAPSGVGVTGGVGFGLDYYINQWFGCYFEYSCRYSYVPFFIANNTAKPYHSPVSSLTFGLKTTL